MQFTPSGQKKNGVVCHKVTRFSQIVNFRPKQCGTRHANPVKSLQQVIETTTKNCTFMARFPQLDNLFSQT
ncbi:MAG: hypothetical protein ACLTZY_12550 [Alistipes indistinctus]